MKRRLPLQISEFLAALSNPYSYDIRSNLYIWFGLLWGLPIPLVTLLFQTHYLEITGARQPLVASLASPVQWFFLFHPVLFGVLFGIMGAIRQEKDNTLNSTILELRNLTVHDALTGLKNRRHFAHIFHDECARNLRRGESLCLLFLDIDHFKNINDTHGHHFGDVVLSELGGYLLSQCRPYDTPVRWGGEEFIILLRATTEEQAARFGERIRRGVEKGFSRKVSIPVTVSLGVAEYRLDDTLESITDRADQALYAAKQLGRNRVVRFSELDPPAPAAGDDRPGNAPG